MSKVTIPSKIIRPLHLTSAPINIDLVGIGGTGSQLVAGLARLHVALRSLGHPHGLNVTLWDGDSVSEANIGRQLFSAGDIGRNKAIVQAHRINHYFGLCWSAKPERFSLSGRQNPDILISCVDTAAARRDIHAQTQRFLSAASRPVLWLDCGNSQRSGQVMLARIYGPPPAYGPAPRAIEGPLMQHLLPEIFDESIPEDNRPSCSLAEALESQDLFINQAVATYAGHLLWSLLREGELSVCGYWINLEEGRTSPVLLSGVRPIKAARKVARNA
jgi:PRTRC genetic system ThiF family protein